MVGQHILGLVGGLIDQSVYSGTGTDQPVGIINTAGATLTTGTSLTTLPRRQWSRHRPRRTYRT